MYRFISIKNEMVRDLIPNFIGVYISSSQQLSVELHINPSSAPATIVALPRRSLFTSICLSLRKQLKA